jgi:ubiquitin-conjugating enzyme E2 A
MNAHLQRTLLRELKAIKQERRTDYAVAVEQNNLGRWRVTLFGAQQTDWEGAVLHLDISFPPQYPIVSPEVRFIQIIPFHPNVYNNGKICLDLLQHNWSAAYGVDAIVTSVQTLLVNPNPSSPANNTAAQLFVHNFGEYQRHVRQCVESTWRTSEIKV